MPVRSSGRNRPLRSRAASSEGSFDASSTAARAAFSVPASYYSPLATASADQQNQPEEDAEGEEEGAVVGGKVDGGSTASDVRFGLTVHNGHAARRAVSDTTTTTKATLPPIRQRDNRHRTRLHSALLLCDSLLCMPPASSQPWLWPMHAHRAAAVAGLRVYWQVSCWSLRTA